MSLARDQTDVLAVQELTPGEVDRLSAAGIDVTFPYRWLDARGGAQGVGLWSRFPLDTTRRIGGFTFAIFSAQIRVPGVSIDPSIVVVHLPGPWPQPIDIWRRDITLLPTTLQEVAERAGTGCVIAAADLNSTTDMRPFRTLLNDGYRDAAEQSGAGITAHLPGRLAATASRCYRSRTGSRLHRDFAAHDQDSRFGSSGPRRDGNDSAVVGEGMNPALALTQVLTSEYWRAQWTIW